MNEYCDWCIFCFFYYSYAWLMNSNKMVGQIDLINSIKIWSIILVLSLEEGNEDIFLFIKAYSNERIVSVFRRLVTNTIFRFKILFAIRKKRRKPELKRFSFNASHHIYNYQFFFMFAF